MSGQKYNIDDFYEVVLELTKNCGQIVKQRFSSRDKKVETKSGITDFVTETDQEIERLLIEGLSTAFPHTKFIGEESVASGVPCDLTDAPTWIIDPVDGTMNFIHAFPHACISIALFIDKQPVIGIIYNPMLEQLFTAKQGKGSFLNGERMSVSNAKNLSEALITMAFGSSQSPEKRRIMLENQEILMPQIHGVEVRWTQGSIKHLNPIDGKQMLQHNFSPQLLRTLGSAALNLAMVACGATDAHYEFGLHLWDIAAGELLITEAGGAVIDPAGGELDRLSRRVLAASSKELAGQLAQQLVQYYPGRD